MGSNVFGPCLLSANHPSLLLLDKGKKKKQCTNKLNVNGRKLNVKVKQDKKSVLFSLACS